MARLLLISAIAFQMLGGGYLVAASDDEHDEVEHIDLEVACMDGCDDSCDPGLPCATDCACTCCPGHGFVTSADCFSIDCIAPDLEGLRLHDTLPHTSPFADRIYRPPRTA